MSTIPKGFAIAGDDGKFYLGHARFRLKKDAGIWNTANKSYDTTEIHVWSPLVEKPVAVRYAWAVSPMGNLKVEGKPWAPLASFRTDECDWPESEDPEATLVDRARSRAMNDEAAEHCQLRKEQEAGMGIEILKRVETIGRVAKER
jgi:hypothetical protein